MKKILLTSCLVVLFSCGNSDADPVDLCAEVKIDLETALTNFTNTTNLDYTDNCSKYKELLENKIKVCGDNNGEIQKIIDDLGDCTNSSTLSMSVGGVAVTFDKIKVSVENGLIKVSGESTESSSYKLSFEVPVNKTGKEIVQSFVARILSSDYTPFTSGGSNVNFTSTISMNEDGNLVGTFGGAVESNNGASVSLSKGRIDVKY